MTALEIRVLVKRVNFMIGKKLDMTDANVSQMFQKVQNVNDYILKLLTKPEMFYCSIYRNMNIKKPEFTMSTLGYLMQDGS